MKNCQMGDREKRSEPRDADNADQRQITYLKVTDYPAMSDSTDLSKIPKRKLSVFYRSFDVIAQIDQESERQNAADFRRTFSSPSVRIERAREEEDADSKNDEQTDRRTNLEQRRDRSSILSGSPPGDRLAIGGKSSDSQVSMAGSLSPVTFKLPQVREGTIVDNYAAIIEASNDNESHERKVADESVAIDTRHNSWSPDLLAGSTVRSFAERKAGGTETAEIRRGNSPQTLRRSISSRFDAPRTDLVKIKDSVYPRSFVNASSAGRLGRYTSVDGEMSSHEDSSIGSDSEDDPIERHAATCTRIERSRSKNDSPLSRPSSFSMDEPSRKPDSREIHDRDVTEEFCSEGAERQVEIFRREEILVGRRLRAISSSSGETSLQMRQRGGRNFRRRRTKKEIPSFSQLQRHSAADHGAIVLQGHRQRVQRKYIAFSIGLGTDRITLRQRMILSLRQRDQSERNFMEEIQKMQEDIKSLCPLCTDQESIDKVENIRHRLDTITRSAHRVSCVAETLGAVYQEHRISRAIFIGDKYLQLLRSRCENLAADIADIKQILLKNNIMIEETGEMGDDLPKLRYRNGLPCNNRMMTRRRASIATISRPLSSQDVIKEIPRQRNSVSGRVNLRRPSLCFETQSSANSVVELRDIFEHTESRRNSVEENNNLLRNNQSSIVGNINCDVASNAKDKDRLIVKQNSFLESSVTNTVEQQLKSCIRTTEPLRITRNIDTWRPILWFTFIFLLGFYAKQITSTFVT
ncbi:hypothetical protein QLX08_011111 [Tetragonisca angustula]|uniref:Lymphoid-restricted membrane protein n=1 Tax=Tetragonisca angustula TaxID=166442 RepID=A0AAW0Z993_9HYME